MFPRPNARYSHHTPFVKASEIPPMPYLGGPEDRFASVFNSTYQSLVHILRTPTFHEHLAAAIRSDGTVGARDLLNRYIADTNRNFMVGIGRELRPIVNVGAATARTESRAKLNLNLTKASSSALAVPDLNRRRRRAPHRRPAPLPPYRRLLRIPPRRSTIPRAIHGRTRGHVEQAYLNAVDLLTLSLVNNINDTQKDKILVALTDSIRKGDDIDRTSMRVANMVGLFPRWQQAVLNLQNRLELQGTLSPRAIQSRVNDYSDWLRERRGIMIARTELIRGLNTGRLISWHEQADQGLLSATESVKTWSSAPDACPDCLALDGTSVTGIDKHFRGPHGWLVMPPAHPHCRCSVTLQPVGMPENDDDAAYHQTQAELDAVDMADPELARILTTMPIFR